MNPSNPFGSPQGGAFQAPGSNMKTGLFQSFVQQGPNTQPQSIGFFQPSAFGQPSVMNQPPAHGNTVFGQAPAFGQTPAQPPSQSPMSQTPAFGQPSLGMGSSSFGSSTTSAFGQTSGQNQSSVFGKTPAFGQPSAFGQVSGFGKQPPAFGQQSSGFGSSEVSTGSGSSLVQPQTVGFGQPAFGQSSSTSSSSSLFAAAQNVTQSRGFGSSEFSFKPANEALFKPIFSASPEPANPQTTSMSSSSFGGSGSQMSSSTTTGFSLLTAAKSGPLGFSFSQPAAAPSISSQNNPLTTGNSSGGTSTPLFTFSQPAAPSSSSTTASATEPTTPSSFSFSAKTLQGQPTQLSGGASFGQHSGFGDTKAKAESSTENKESTPAGQGDANIFGQFSKGTKRKDDLPMSASGLEQPAAGEESAKEVELPRHPSKRPLIRSRGPGGLFGRAISNIRKDHVKPVRREATKETQKEAPKWEDKKEEFQAQSDDASATPPTPPTMQTMTRDVQEKIEKSDPDTGPKTEVLTPKTQRGRRSDSLDSLSGVSPNDLTTILCRNVPKGLNKKDVIEKHFSRFGKVHKIFCRPAKGIAIVHFGDHATAARAKKKGKMLYEKELLLLWQRKKQSPGDKERRPAEQTEEAEDQSQEVTDSKPASSPLRRPALRPAALSSSFPFTHSSPVRKPSPVKQLQFDTEPQKESSTESQISERPVPSSLLILIGQVAETTEDKYRFLEQRDKILRQGRLKRTDLDMSKVFVGTCPDMCPEKERYMRETRNQLSVFEVIPDTEMVDHASAIKEYSRSSADQEEPLPHELRPLPVLSMTMDYLVTQIMDQGQDNYRDWYDFVWNRTRGIRKDITQQRLCCPQTVSLIEKCTRFHVHCAHHLCEERLSSFDAKINNENMTKCLQSLKEMYEDLALQQTFCTREAEFRQYSVLLKLNDGDILREVQQFRDDVRNSPQVKFAVQAFAAVSSNNFVRFFKLVKRASYLASCLLHRYFNQVRAKALKALNMAHTVGPRSTPFPVEDVVRMLMFTNAAEATDFIQQHGLNISDGMVELSRTAFQEPDLPLSHKKSEVILAKKTMLIGQLVNGDPLPNPPQHIPVCSFDSQNKYRGEGPLTEAASSFIKATSESVEFPVPPSIDQLTQFVQAKAPDALAPFGLPRAVTDETGEARESYQPPTQTSDSHQLFQPVFKPESVKPPSPPPKPQPVYSDEDLMVSLNGVIEEVVEEGVREIAGAGSSYAAAALVESGVQVESLVNEVLGQMLQEISTTEVKLEQERVAEEKRKLEEARRREEHNAFLAQFSCSLCTEIIHEVLNETIKDTASSEIQKAVNEKAECVAKCTELICNSLIEETLKAGITLLVGDILETELQRIHKYIKRWRDVVAVRRQLKRQMRGFPAAPCCVDPRFKLKALAPSAPTQPSIADLARGLVNLGNAGTLAVSSTRLLKIRQKVIHQMKVHHYYQQLLEETAWMPLNLPALVTENIPDPQERIFWKALLLLPCDDESVASMADRVLSDWLEVKFGGNRESEEQLDGTLQTLCIVNTLVENEQRAHKVHVAVKVSRGPLSEDGLLRVEEYCELQGTGALVLLLPPLSFVEPGPEEQDVPLLSALLQLKQLQQANTWHCPLPLVILVPGPGSGNTDTQKLEEALMLHTLIKEGLISAYAFVFIPETTSDIQGSKQLSQALCWLLARAPPPFPLSCQTLVQLIEAGLSREFNPRVYANRQERAAAHLPPQDPAPVIQLYNAVLDHIANIVTSQDLCGLSWPPGEFSLPQSRNFVPHLGWNSGQHLAWLREAILSLQLPEWEQLSTTGSWVDLCSSVFRYAAQIPASNHSQPLLMSRLDNFLEKVKLRTRHTQTPGYKITTRQSEHAAYGWIPWDDVVVICIDHKLKDWQIPGSPVCDDAVTEGGEILVYFPAKSLKGFQPPEEWTEAVRQTHREKQQEEDGMSASACAPSASFSVRQRLFPSLEEPVRASRAPLDITHTPTAQELLAHKVLQGLEEEKAESQRSMEKLQHWLDGEPLDHLSIPLFIPSSTLLSMPTTIKCLPTNKTEEATFIEIAGPEETSETAVWPKITPVSMTLRLKDLERQILASQEEELTCRLKLSGLLSIVDD